ncbi:MAG: hypothetical protein H6757_00020 [Candidatus Omnitrophica bacterium]|nr:hypothetical protein [Candidatus Omnitrophota bacterium]
MFKILIFIGLLIAGSYAAGIRLHPENVPLYFNPTGAHEYYELELNNGNKLAGKLVRESPEHIEITIGGGTVTFVKADILKIRKLSNEEMHSEPYLSLINRENSLHPPLWTRRYEDSILPMVSKTAGDIMSQLSEKMMDEMSKKGLFQNSKIQAQLQEHKAELQQLVQKFNGMQAGQTAAVPANIDKLMNNPELMHEIQKASQNTSSNADTSAMLENYLKKS